MSEKSSYEIHYAEYDKWFDDFPTVFASELRAIEQVLPPPGDWIEIGVGTGRFASALGIPIGIEPCEQMAAIARSRGIEVIAGRAEALPLRDACVDAVFLITVLCYVPALGRALEEVHRVLRPSGHAIIATVPRTSPIGNIYASAGPEDPFFYDAILRTPQELADAMREACLPVDRASQTLFDSPDRASKHVEDPREGHDRGSFVVLRGRKRPSAPCPAAKRDAPAGEAASA